jgi:ABC-2 type transport system ATP-binding protein
VTADARARRGPQESAIVCEGLTKCFGDLVALDRVSFAVPAGQVVAVLGPNGAGKTTTMELMEGYLAPTAGTVRVLGADPRRGGRAWRARIGLVLQSTSLDDQLTVRELLAVFAQLYPNPRPVPEVLELIDLAGQAGTRVGALSGGQRRRVDVALGLIGRPELLFLDEPTTGLDPEARRRAWAGVEHLAAAGTTVLLTTHYIEEANQLADRVLVLAGGRILADTTPDQLRSRGGLTTIRYPLPAAAPVTDLPAALARHLGPDHQALVVRSADVTATLGDLVGWAQCHHLDLTGLEVGPPSLEDAYLAITGQPLTQETNHRG